MSSCCEGPSKKLDLLLWGTTTVIFICYVIILSAGVVDFSGPVLQTISEFCHSVKTIIDTMYWGILAGVLSVGLLARVPKEFVIALLGPPGVGGILRASVAGIFFDLCNHGVLLIAGKLYERGASNGQTIAFLVATPWNSLSVTFILIALIGLKWTLLFIFLSLLIAIATGLAFEKLSSIGYLTQNPNRSELPKDFMVWQQTKKNIKTFDWGLEASLRTLKVSVLESRMILRWIFLGIIIAACIRTFVHPDDFSSLVGPTLMGLALTIGAATIIEVCSEGSSPIAADIFNRAQAPGNAFAFLMAGVSTDYTEIVVLKQISSSWRYAMALPLLSLPQIILLGWLINHLVT